MLLTRSIELLTVVSRVRLGRFVREDWPMWFRKRNVDQYVIDTSCLDRDDEVAACRAALDLIAPDVARFQCDVLWDNSAQWPDDVVRAATALVPHELQYEATGWVTDFPDSVWHSFVTFAPYALSADAWTAEMKSLAEVEDEGTSLVVRILPDQIVRFEESTLGAEIVPLKLWRKRRTTGTGFVQVENGVVGWFNGGEPIEGCDVISVLVFADSNTEVKNRLKSIGLWSPYLMDGFGDPDPDGVQAAVRDPGGYVWNHARGGGWMASADLPRPQN